MCEKRKSNSNALDPTHGFMLYLKHLQFLEYRLGFEHERGRNTDGRRAILMTYKVYKYICELMQSSF